MSPIESGKGDCGKASDRFESVATVSYWVGILSGRVDLERIEEAVARTGIVFRSI
jgi:hypothetical protein